MEKLDINKLHSPIQGGRGQGRTVKMVAELIGNVDLSGPNDFHVVWIPDGRPKHYMVDSIGEVATAMGVDISQYVRSKSEFTFKNGAKVVVLNQSQKDRMRGCRYREFFD